MGISLANTLYIKKFRCFDFSLVGNSVGISKNNRRKKCTIFI